jgi:hypothetical protein
MVYMRLCRVLFGTGPCARSLTPAKPEPSFATGRAAPPGSGFNARRSRIMSEVQEQPASAITLKIGGNTKRSRFAAFERTVDVATLPANAMAFIVHYGLKQYLQDGMAGAETEAEAVAGVDERIGKLKSGDLSRARGESDKPDSVESRAIKLAKAFLRDQLKAANKTAPKEKVAEAAATLVTSQPKWKAEAKKQLDNEAKAKEALSDEDSAAILADLLGTDEPEADDETGDAEA